MATLLVTDSVSLDEIDQIPGEVPSELWEWQQRDFQALLWPRKQAEESGSISRYENGIRNAVGVSPEVIELSLSKADEAFAALKALEGLNRERGDNAPQELDRILEAGHRTFFQVLRAVVPLDQCAQLKEEADSRIQGIRRLVQQSRYMSEQECDAAREFSQLLESLAESLAQSNPKAEALLDAIASRPDLTVLVHHQQFSQLVESSFRRADMATVDPDNPPPGGVIIPAWFGRERMSRMLVPPLATPLVLLLYELESRWYRGLVEIRANRRAARLAQTNRSKLFPGILGWKEVPRPTRSLPEPQTGQPLGELESLDRQARQAAYRRIYQQVRSEGSEKEVQALLVLFEGGAHAFLTDSYRTRVATLVVEEGEDAELQIMDTSQLREGDWLLFPRGADRDVLRMTADRLFLEPGVRERASLWRKALRRYSDSRQLEVNQVWERLREVGCRVGPQAVGNWLRDDEMIGPLHCRRDVPAIAALTEDDSLKSQVETCLEAIGEVRSAHLRASSHLAKRVVQGALDALRSGSEVEEGVVLVRVDQIDQEAFPVRSSVVNRLIDG
ncbi:MAG: DrmE family protein [Acidobacteriota bacterium]